MIKYFSHLASFNQPKNKLQHLALCFLQDESNQLVYNEEVFIAAVRQAIQQLNYEHQTCTALQVSTYGMGGQISISLGADFTVSFHLYPVKNGGAE